METSLSKLKYYRETSKNLWQGRIDHPSDPDSARFHQAVKLFDLRNLSKRTHTGSPTFALLGFACDEGVRRNHGRVGAAEGPKAIRKELAKLPANFLPKAVLLDVGDIICENEDMEGAQLELSIVIETLLDFNIKPLVLGGGHEVVYGHYSGIAAHTLKTETKPPLLINLDAHLDLRPTNDQGTSGTSFYQIARDHADKNLPFNYICIGTQTYGNTRSLYKTADELDVKYYNAKDLTETSKGHVLNQILSAVSEHSSCYLTLDFDVINSAYVPGVSSPQPFGISPEMLLYFVKPLLRTGKIKSLDIAEVSPRYDDDNQTSKLAAVVLYAIINVLCELESGE